MEGFKILIMIILNSPLKHTCSLRYSQNADVKRDLEVKMICPQQHDYAYNLCSAHTYVYFSSPWVTHHGGVKKMHCRGDSNHKGLIISIRCKCESNRDTNLQEVFFLRSALLLLLWCISRILQKWALSCKI